MNERDSTTAERSTDLGPIAVLLAALAAIGLGAGVSATVGGGLALPALLAAVAGVAVGRSLTLLRSSSLGRLALGSCGLLCGLAVLAPAAVAAGALAVTIAVATGATAVALAPGASFHVTATRAVRSSAVSATLVAAAGALVLFGGVGAAELFLTGLVALATSTPFVGFATLQLLLIAAALFGCAAASVLEPAIPARLDVPSVNELLARVADLPAAVHYAFVGQVVLWFVPATAGLFESALLALGPLGAVVAAGLTSGVLHVPLGAIVLVTAAVCVAATFAPLGRAWLEPYPLRTLAFSAGGLPVGVAAVALAATVTPRARTPFLVLFLGFAAAFLAFEVLARAAVSRRWLDGWRRPTLGVGALAVFATAALAALAGLEAAFVFVGVAASILVWDVGENALSTRRQLGPAVDSRQAELVHALGSALVGLVGVAVAAGALYGLGSVSPPAYRWQAVVPVALGLAAVVAFAVVLLGAGVGGSRLFDRLPRTARLARSARDATTHPVAVPVVASLVIAVAMVVAGGSDFAPLLFFLFVIALPIALLVWLERSGADDDSGRDRVRNPPRM